MGWSVYPLTDNDIRRLEEEASYGNDYCAWCDFGEGTPEDDCFCEENCGVIGCQGQYSPVLE